MRAERRGRLLVVSHASVVPVNQAVYVRLAELGWDPLVVVPGRWRHDFSPDDFAPRPFAGLEGRLLPLPVALPGRPQRHVYLSPPGRVLRRFRPDFVFIEEEPFSIPGWQWARAARRHGVPYGLQAAENLDRPFPLPARLIRSRILPGASLVAARSPAAASLARRWGARGLVDVAPHAIPDWSPVGRREHPTFTIGYAGRLVPEKGLHVLLRAAALLRSRVRLLLVGDGPLRRELLAAAAPNVEVDHRPDVDHADMPAAYAEMDVLALPSLSTERWTEQFGRVLVEALSCGVAVVGSDSGEIPWVIATTGGGLVVPEGDDRSLGDALATMRDDPGLRASLAETGRLAVDRLFSLDAAAEALDGMLLASVAESA